MSFVSIASAMPLCPHINFVTSSA